MPLLKRSVLIVFLLLSVSLSAQQWRFGMHITPSFNYISTDQPDVNTTPSLLAGFGGLVEYQFTDNYAIASGFNINRRGGKLTADGREGEYTTGYLEFPINLKMRTRQFGYLSYFGQFGLSANFKTSDGAQFTPEVPQNALLDNYVNFFNSTFHFGFGGEYDLGGSSVLSLGLSYNRSLFDNLIADDPRLNSRYNYRFDFIAMQIGFLF